jgi:uncharacterized membrane protein YraQ (UPF0718 family)
MLDLITNPTVQTVLAILIAALLGWILKKTVEWQKVKTIIQLIIALCLEEEGKQRTNEQKTLDVAKIIDRNLDEKSRSRLHKWGGTTIQAVSKAYKKFAKPLVKSGLFRLIDKIR